LSNSIYYTRLTNFDYYKSRLKSEEENKEIEKRIFSNLKDIGFCTTLEHSIGSKDVLFYGINLSDQEYRPDFFKKKINGQTVNYETEKLRLRTFSVFGHNEYKIGQWLFNIGLRASLYDNGEKSLWALAPRLKVNRMIGEGNKIMFAYDMMHQPVHSLNEMSYSIQNDFWIPFRENKLPASHQFSIGWKSYIVPNLVISAEAYYKEMKNLLLIKNVENYIDFHTDFEEGKGNSKGLEIMAEYTWDKYNLLLSYTLSKSTRSFDGKKYPFKYDAPHDLSLYGSYILRHKSRIKNTLSLNMQYKSGYPYYIPEIKYPGMGLPTQGNGYPFYDTSNVDYVPGYPNVRLSNYFRVDPVQRLSNRMR
jgi:hypothetical protein